jgi:hypothetical protein
MRSREFFCEISLRTFFERSHRARIFDESEQNRYEISVLIKLKIKLK